MRCLWREWMTAVVVLSFPAAAAAQGRELGTMAIGTLSTPGLAVASGYAALRTSGRTRLSANLGAGISDQELAWRGEVLAHFLLSPGEQRKSGFYFAGGVAAVTGPVRRGYLVLTLGVEGRPGGSSGWALEAGVGGGVRIAVGYRWRWMPKAFPSQ